MKKINIMILAGAALTGFAACDDAPATPQPQQNPQPAVITAADVAFSPAEAIAAGELNIAALAEAGADSVAVLDVTKCDNLAEGYVLVPEVYLSDTDDFAKSGSFICDVRDGKAYASLEDVSNAYAAVFGWQNTPEAVYTRTRALAEYDNSGDVASAIVGNQDTYYAETSFTLTPDLMLSLYAVMSEGDATSELRTNDGVNYWGYVNVKSSFWFSNGLTGDRQKIWDGGGLVLSGNPIGIAVPETGCVWVAYNIELASLSTTAITTYGAIGDFPDNSWSSSVPLTQTSDPMIWRGDVTFGAGGWKFRANDGWDINLGGSPTDLIPGGDNLDSPGEGLYEVTLDLSHVPYSMTAVNKL